MAFATQLRLALVPQWLFLLSLNLSINLGTWRRFVPVHLGHEEVSESFQLEIFTTGGLLTGSVGSSLAEATSGA
jgi:hypothetical protein